MHPTSLFNRAQISPAGTHGLDCHPCALHPGPRGGGDHATSGVRKADDEASATESTRSGDKPLNRYAALDEGQEEDADAEDDDEEHLADIHLDQPALPSQGTSASTDTSKVRFGPDMQFSDACLSALEFVGEYQDVRELIRGQWRKYANEELELDTVALTTNTALELLRSQHDEHIVPLLQFVPEEYSYGGVFNFLFNSALIELEEDPSSAFRIAPRMSQIPEDDKLTHALFDQFSFPTFQILMNAVRAISTQPRDSPGLIRF